MISAAALTGGYLYWDHIAHFEWTDDAFVAARQFAVGPKVSGYIIGIPVTDNQHVGAGDVIAQIDQRFRLDCATGANPIVAVSLYRCLLDDDAYFGHNGTFGVLFAEYQSGRPFAKALTERTGRKAE